MNGLIRRYQTTKKVSPTLLSVLYYVFRKENIYKRISHHIVYSDAVMDGLVELGFLKKVISKKKGTFFFTTEKSKNFKAIDLAKEYLWAFHNSLKREKKEDKRLIYCFSNDIPNGKGLVEINEAINKCYA